MKRAWLFFTCACALGCSSASFVVAAEDQQQQISDDVGGSGDVLELDSAAELGTEVPPAETRRDAAADAPSPPLDSSSPPPFDSSSSDSSPPPSDSSSIDSSSHDSSSHDSMGVDACPTRYECVCDDGYTALDCAGKSCPSMGCSFPNWSCHGEGVTTCGAPNFVTPCPASPDGPSFCPSHATCAVKRCP